MESRTTQLLVIGGGPGGTTVATLTAKAGVEVILLEADAHPRAHVGESRLPGMLPILEAMGVLAEVEAAGFGHKTGSTHFGWGSTPEWDLWFADPDLYEHAWLVGRSRARASTRSCRCRPPCRCPGARVLEHCPAKELLWEEGRLCGVRYRRRGDGDVVTGTIRAQLVVDATGQAALLARTLDLREHLPGWRHQASWAHFEGAAGLAPPRISWALSARSSAFSLGMKAALRGRSIS